MHNHSGFPQQINRLTEPERAEVISRAGDLAVALLGRPDFSDRKQMRWGAHGALALELGGRKAGLWFDHASGEGGDIFDLIQRERGCTFPEAVEWATGVSRVITPRYTLDRRTRSIAEHDRIQYARTLYNEARPADDEGRAYFEGRGLDYLPEVARQMRFARTVFKGFEGEQRTLLMPVFDIHTRALNAVHRIALDIRDGGGKRVKRTNGVAASGAMMLGRADRILTVCEGLETGVGAIMGGLARGAVWAFGSASILKTFEPHEGVRDLIICADNDENRTGQNAASACARLWEERAVVTIHTPRRKGQDFADLYARTRS